MNDNTNDTNTNTTNEDTPFDYDRQAVSEELDRSINELMGCGMPFSFAVYKLSRNIYTMQHGQYRDEFLNELIMRLEDRGLSRQYILAQLEEMLEGFESDVDAWGAR